MFSTTLRWFGAYSDRLGPDSTPKRPKYAIAGIRAVNQCHIHVV